MARPRRRGAAAGAQKLLHDPVLEGVKGDDRQAAAGAKAALGGDQPLLKLVQFGTLTVRDKSPRRGRNPRTGESMTITKRQMVSFRPSKRLRERLNK